MFGATGYTVDESPRLEKEPTWCTRGKLMARDHSPRAAPVMALAESNPVPQFLLRQPVYLRKDLLSEWAVTVLGLMSRHHVQRVDD